MTYLSSLSGIGTPHGIVFVVTGLLAAGLGCIRKERLELRLEVRIKDQSISKC